MDVCPPLSLCLPRESIDQIKAEVGDAALTKGMDGRVNLLSRMASIEEDEVIGVKALHTHTHSVDRERS